MISAISLAFSLTHAHTHSHIPLFSNVWLICHLIINLSNFQTDDQFLDWVRKISGQYQFPFDFWTDVQLSARMHSSSHTQISQNFHFDRWSDTRQSIYLLSSYPIDPVRQTNSDGVQSNAFIHFDAFCEPSLSSYGWIKTADSANRIFGVEVWFHNLGSRYPNDFNNSVTVTWSFYSERGFETR